MLTLTQIADLLKQQKEGWSLDQQFYTDPSIYELELEEIVTRNWIFAGHSSQIPEQGDYIVFTVAKESAIIVRSDNDSIKAFANVCRHRGSRICLEKSGNSKKFTCPYHAWMYDLDGNLTAARAMPEDFDKSDFSLHPVSIEILGGLIFVSFSDNPPSMKHAADALAEPLEMFGFKDLKVAAQKTYPIAANWKLAVENYMECYHCAPAHAEYAKMHTLMLDRKRRERVQQHMLDKMESCGLREIVHDFDDHKAKPGSLGFGYSRTALFEGYETGSRDGKPIAPLLGNITGYDGGASDFSIGPMSFFLAYSDHVVGYVFTPVSQQQCECKIYWLVRDDAVEGRDYDKAELMWLWDITTYADEKIIINNQAGVNSRHYQPGPFSDMERTEKSFVSWLVGQLLDAVETRGKI